MCIHDSTTKRTARENLAVAQSTLAELRRLDVRRWRGAKWARQRIATLEEVLAVAPAAKRILIEVKCGPQIVPVLKSVLESSRLTLEQTILISFSAKLVAEAKKQLPKPKPFWLTGFGKDKKIGAGAPRLRTCSPPSRRFRRTAWTVRPSLAPLTAPSCRSFEPGGWNCTSRLSTTSRPPCIPGNSGPIRSPRTAPLAVGTDGQTANPPPRAQPPAEPTSNVLSVRNLAEIS